MLGFQSWNVKEITHCKEITQSNKLTNQYDELQVFTKAYVVWYGIGFFMFQKKSNKSENGN